MAISRNTSRALQRQIDLTTAVCQERILATHVKHVLALVDLVSDGLPFDSALDIYVRILHLNPEQARNVGSRALAALGTRGGLPAAEDLQFDRTNEPLPREEEGVDQSGRFDAVFSRVRRRIRGRVQEDLRQRINLATARAEDAIFETHVANALIFARALADEVALPEAVELYLETLMIPEGVSDVVFNRALRTVADEILPPLERDAAAREAEVIAAEVAATAGRAR